MYIQIFKKSISLFLALVMIYFFYQIPNQKFLINSYLQIHMQNHYLNEAETCLDSSQDELFKKSPPIFNLSGLGYNDETFSAADMCLRRYGKKVDGLEDYNSYKTLKETFLFKNTVDQTLNKQSDMWHVQYILSEIYPAKIKYSKDLCSFLSREHLDKNHIHTLLLICYNLSENTEACFDYKNKLDLTTKLKTARVCNEAI